MADNDREKEPKVFKILTIDGGGIKGLYSAQILRHFEEKFECRISDYFDMLCGTSTGGYFGSICASHLSLLGPVITVQNVPYDQ